MSVAKYYPFNGARGRLRLGLGQIDRSEWIQYENNFVARIQEKKKLINAHGKRVLDAQEGSTAAQQELLKLVVSYLQEYKKDLFEVKDDKIINLHDNAIYKPSEFAACPLELISYLVVDDYCLLKNNGDDYKLVAASICAPTWWELSEKMGKPLTAIHAPIENLEQTIGRMIRHFLRNLSKGEFYQRSNWFLSTNPEFCVFPNQVKSVKKFSAITQDNIEEHLYLRTERQTFHKLNNSEHIAFGIKVYVDSIDIIKDQVAIAEDLMIAIKTMSEAQKQTIGIAAFEKPLTEYLQQAV